MTSFSVSLLAFPERLLASLVGFAKPLLAIFFRLTDRFLKILVALTLGFPAVLVTFATCVLEILLALTAHLVVGGLIGHHPILQIWVAEIVGAGRCGKAEQDECSHAEFH